MKKLITLLCIGFYAITVQAQNTGDYQSIKSGNWTDITVWKRYNGSNWVNASVPPGSTDGVISIRDLTTVTVNTNITIDQTVVDAGGVLSLTSASYTVSLNNSAGYDLTVNGDFNWLNGSIDGAGAIGINGSLTWAGGNLKVSLTNEGTTMIGFVYLWATSVFENNGTVNWYYDSDIRFYGGKFNNNNIFNAYGNGVLYNYSSGGIFNNNKTGIFNVQCSNYVTNNITFNNKGKMNLMAGGFYNYSGTFTNTKILNFSGGNFQNRGAASIENGTKVTGSGYISLNNYTMNFNTAVSLPAGITLNIYGGSNIAGSGSINLSGILYWHYGNISVPFTIAASGVAYIYNYSGYLYSTLTNNGTINWNGYDLKCYNGAIINNKQFNINCNDDLTQYNTTYKGSFTNNASGTVIKMFPGANTIGVAFANKGTIAGIGSLAFGANLTNSGTFDPGIGTVTGILSTGTDFKNEVLNLRITGSDPGLDFDRLVVNGNAAVGTSTLKVTASGSVPAGSYVIISCSGTRTGTFSTATLPAGYSLTYKTNQVILNVPAPLTAQAVNEADVMAKSLKNLLSVSPNPASQSIKVSFPSKNKSATLQIFDDHGKAVLQKTIAPSISNSLNISRLVPGAYVVQIKDGELTQSAKFIKQ